MLYVVRYYSPHGEVIKEEFHEPVLATARWLDLVQEGHRSVKLRTVPPRP